VDEREAGRMKGSKARLLWMRGKLGWVKGRKARLLWMRGKLAG
jgi:hypothetical protein